jgi:hypothetical protein
VAPYLCYKFQPILRRRWGRSGRSGGNKLKNNDQNVVEEGGKW